MKSCGSGVGVGGCVGSMVGDGSVGTIVGGTGEGSAELQALKNRGTSKRIREFKRIFAICFAQI